MGGIREILNEAYRLDDEARRDFERWEARRLQRKSSDTNLVFKITENARVQTEAPSQAPPPQQPDPWAGWNDWCDARIEKMFKESFVLGIGEALALERERRREEMQPIIDGLQRQIDELRAELKITRDLARGGLALVRKSESDAA